MQGICFDGAWLGGAVRISFAGSAQTCAAMPDKCLPTSRRWASVGCPSVFPASFTVPPVAAFRKGLCRNTSAHQSSRQVAGLQAHVIASRYRKLNALGLLPRDGGRYAGGNMRRSHYLTWRRPMKKPAADLLRSGLQFLRLSTFLADLVRERKG